MKSLTNIAHLKVNPLAFLAARKTSSLNKVKVGPKNFILVYHPELAREVLIQQSEIFIQNRTIFDRIKPVTGRRGLVQLQGAESREARKKVRPFFSPKTLESLRPIIGSYAEESFGRLNEASPLESSSLMSNLILRTAFKLFLGIDIEEASQELSRDFLLLNQICGRRMTSIVALPDPRVFKLRKRLRLKIQNLILGSDVNQTSLLTFLKGDEDLIDHCMTFLFAGHETTASSLAFTLLLLADHPDLQARIAAGDEELTLKVYQEALRLYPPAYMLVREANQKIELGGMRIEEGDQVIVGVREIQRDSYYYQDPHLFLPGRPIVSKAFMPFGLGLKSCIGESLAYAEAKIVLMAFFRKFEILERPEAITAVPHITLHPTPGQLLRIRRRRHG